MNSIKKLVIVAITAITAGLPIASYAASYEKLGQSVDFQQYENNSSLQKEENENTSEKNLKGWNTTDGNKYYYTDDNKKAEGWTNIDDKWYYFDTSGKLLTGWILDDTKWYYSDSNGEKKLDGLL
ncbi:hypothetical protein [Clostridium butyricum]